MFQDNRIRGQPSARDSHQCKIPEKDWIILDLIYTVLPYIVRGYFYDSNPCLLNHIVITLLMRQGSSSIPKTYCSSQRSKLKCGLTLAYTHNFDFDQLEVYHMEWILSSYKHHHGLDAINKRDIRSMYPFFKQKKFLSTKNIYWFTFLTWT